MGMGWMAQELAEAGVFAAVTKAYVDSDAGQKQIQQTTKSVGDQLQSVGDQLQTGLFDAVNRVMSNQGADKK